MSTTNSTTVTTTEADNDRYREAGRRLADRTAAICERLEHEVSRAQLEFEIDWRALLASQRDIAEQASKGTAPQADVFWMYQAEPRADDLLNSCLASVDAHLVLLWDALSSYWRTATSVVTDESARETMRSDVERLVAPIRTFHLDRTSLDDVGERWQQRLRRQAIRRYVRTGGETNDGFSAAIDDQELQMMSQAPWAQADQLLSAFELVHTDVRRAITERVDRIIDDVLAA